MLLTLTYRQPPASDLGFLLHKHPERLHTRELPFGNAHVFYPKNTDDECTAALLLEIDPIALVRRGFRGETHLALQHYVNDRPYVASSFLSVAIAKSFSTAMAGTSGERPELAAQALPLEARLPVVPCRGGAEYLARLFEPLGYAVSAVPITLSAPFLEDTPPPYYDLTLRGTVRLADLLAHLYVLIPVLDREKHYWMGPDEVEKLLRRGEGWLQAHPERESIVRRYLQFRHLTRMADALLANEDGTQAEERDESAAAAEDTIEQPLNLHEQRLDRVAQILKECGAQSVVDLGCGEGKLLGRLLRMPQFKRIAGMDVSVRALKHARDNLHLDRLPAPARERITLFHGSLLYQDARLAGYDAAALVEVIEHLDAPRLMAMERVVFEHARPGLVLITTPNREYNALFPNLATGKMRHPDHRFEWSREEFEQWATGVAARFRYTVAFEPLGPVSEAHGAPTQLGILKREGACPHAPLTTSTGVGEQAHYPHPSPLPEGEGTRQGEGTGTTTATTTRRMGTCALPPGEDTGQ